MKRLVTWLVLVPLGIVLVVFALANRQPVRLGLDPISPDTPFVEPAQIPLFVVMYAFLLAGVFLGGVGAWFTHARRRAGERHWRREAEALRAELEAERREKRTDDALALLDDHENG